MNTDSNVSALWEAQEENQKLRARCAELEGLLREAYSCVYYARNKQTEQTEKAPYDNLIVRIDAALGKDKPHA